MLLLIALLSAGAWAQSPIPDKRVAVYSFKLDNDNCYYNRNLESYLRALLEEKADGHGFTLLARQENYQAIREEKGLEEIDPVTKAPRNQLYGATAIIELVGRVEVYESNSRMSYSGYSLNLGNRVKVICRIVGKIIDVRTGRMRVVSATVAKSSTGSIGAGTHSGNYEVKFHDNSIKGQLIGAGTEEAVEKIVVQLKDKIPSQESWPASPPATNK